MLTIQICPQILHLYAGKEISDVVTMSPICFPLCRIFIILPLSGITCFAYKLINWACRLHPTDTQNKSILFPQNVEF